MIWYSGDISSNKAEDWIKWWSNEVAGMGTQNAALAGVTPDVCVWRGEARIPTLTKALHLKAEGLILCGDKGACIHATLGMLGACPGRHWAFYLPHSMAVALLASHTDISTTGSADIVPPDCPCSIHLYWAALWRCSGNRKVFNSWW